MTGCGLRHVNVLDYIASSQEAGLSRRPTLGPTPSIALRFDGWVLPKAGVAFVWVLKDEMTTVEPDGHRDIELGGRPCSVPARRSQGR